jgi:hypothetical protein
MLLLETVFSWGSNAKLLSDALKTLLVLERLYLILKLLKSDLLPAGTCVVMLPDEGLGQCVELRLAEARAAIVFSIEVADVQKGNN